MKVRINKNLLYINPIFLFLIGSFIGILPGLLKTNEVFLRYGSFERNNEIFLVYLIGFLFFVFGYLSIFLKYKRIKYKIEKPKYKTIIILLSILTVILLVNINSYGGIPLIMIFKGRNISHINKVQKQSSIPGIYGLQNMIIYALIILMQRLIIYLKNIKKSRFKKLLWIHLFLLVFSATYSGKRQMIFILLTSTLSFMWIYITLNKDIIEIKKFKKKALFILLLSISLFIIIGLVRTDVSNINFKNLFDPILDYASFPYINLNRIINLSSTNSYRFSLNAFSDTFLSGLPSLFNVNYKTIENIPLLEKTSPSTVYGIIFWNFGYIGVSLFMYIIGLFIGYIYRKAISNNKLFMSIYSLCVWPLLSIHTYNHFLNTMFLFFPIIIVILFEFYKTFLKGI
jgi:oligosaccharide repeat unit polymerase